jgi:hypothetical protein
MPSAGEIRKQVARESEWRGRLAVSAFGGGFLYLLSAIIITETLNAAPTVGLLQGLAPALSGEANPAVSPSAQEVKYISHHAFPLIAGGTLAAIAFVVLTAILVVLLDATRFRRPEMWVAVRPLVIGGGAAVAILSVGREVVSTIEAHNFAVGHDHTIHAAEEALKLGTANSIADYLGLLATLALAVGMIALMVNALRVGLLARWMAMLGMVVAFLIFVPIGGSELEIVQAFWMVMMGVLFAGKWPNGEPPAWKAGEAVPWPSRVDVQASARGAGSAQPALAGAGAADAGPAPAPTPAASGGSSRKRRRKRG